LGFPRIHSSAMRVLVQRILRAVAEVDGVVESRVGAGLLVYVGFRRGENVAKVEKLAKTIAKLHLFPELADPEKVFSSSVVDNGFEILVAAQPSLCVDFDKQVPRAAAPIDSAEAKTAFNAFVRALQAEYQEEMVVAAPLSPLLQVESSGDGPGMYMFDTDAPSSADAPATRATVTSVKQETTALEPTIASVTAALCRVPSLKGSKATLESCRIFRVFSMKKFRASLADAGQTESDDFAEALDAAGSFFSRTQQAQITDWTGLAITASPEEAAAAPAAEDAGDDDFEADEADAEAADGLAQSLAELRGEVSGQRFAANADKAARRPDWRGRAAPNTPAGTHASTWANSRFGGQNAAPWQGKGKGKGNRPPGRSYGIASLDEANRLHGNDGSAYEYGQLMRVSDKNVHVAKKELDDDDVAGAGAKRRAPTSTGGGFKRPKGTPTIAPMCPDAANPLDEL